MERLEVFAYECIWQSCPLPSHLTSNSYTGPGGAVVEGGQAPQRLLWEPQPHAHSCWGLAAMTTFWSREAQLFLSPQVPTQLGPQSSKRSSCSAWGDGRKNILCAALSFQSQVGCRGRTLLSLESQTGIKPSGAVESINPTTDL